jgi:hypothetical protein
VSGGEGRRIDMRIDMNRILARIFREFCWGQLVLENIRSTEVEVMTQDYVWESLISEGR